MRARGFAPPFAQPVPDGAMGYEVGGASGEDWWWQFNDDKTDMLPSYAVENPLEGKGPNHRAT